MAGSGPMVLPDGSVKHLPKHRGLWVWITLVDGTALDAVLSENLLKCKPWKGITIATYPEFSIPHHLLASVEVLQLIGVKSGDNRRRQLEVPKR